MRSRFTITAALALGAATILAVAACGSSVQGSAQANTEAAATMTSAASTGQELTTSVETTAQDTARATDLTELLNELPTELGIPTDLSIPTDFSIPSELSELTDLSIPGYSSECLSVASAYANISLALLPALFGGTEGFNAGDLNKSLSELSANVPPELAGDIKVLTDAATAANGKSLSEASQIFGSDEFSTAQSNIDAWLSANCGG